MNYWLDLFTGTTWDEFRKAGGKITGFRQRMQKHAQRVKPGDIFLCYLTGVMRWVGALEVVGSTKDTSPIWALDTFPVRFAVKPLIALDADVGVPMQSLEGKLLFYSGPEDRGGYKGFPRMSTNLFRRPGDGEVIINALRQAERNPVATPVDPRKLARKPGYFKVEFRKGKTAIPTIVSVPDEHEEDEAAEPDATGAQGTGTRHTEIQFNLLRLGNELGQDVWAARNDRGKSYNGSVLGSMPGMLDELPTQFNAATNRTIELIDVLWLKGNTIVAAFEIEATTSVYSGLLRMSDLLALQPNLDLALYLVAPEARRAKVSQEITRPTFAYREKPLSRICGFLGFKKLMEKVEGIRRLSLRPPSSPSS